MGVLRENQVLTKVALILTVLSFVFLTIAVFTPWWQQKKENGAIIYTGLLVTCNNTVGDCSGLQAILDEYTDSGFHSTTLITLALSLVGWVFNFVALAGMVIYFCFAFQMTGVVSIVFCLLSGVFATAAVILYGVMLRIHLSTSLSYSFGFAITGGVLAVIAGGVLGISIGKYPPISPSPYK